MSFTIAVAGKGGTGKTTFCGLLIDHLCKKNKGPVLAVDADANSNLNEVLGVTVEATLGEIREQIAAAGVDDDSPIPAGMTKQDYLDYRFGQALVEQDDYDLIVMGRTQGQGCYCFVNGILQTQLEKYAGRYGYVVVDNEAGMEHVSRGLLPKVDMLLLISDCSRRGVQAVGRIERLAGELGLSPTTVKLVINRAPNGVLADGLVEEIAAQDLDLAGVLPQDDMVYEFDSAGKPTVTLPESSPFRVAFGELMKSLNL